MTGSHVDLAALELRDPSASVSWMLRLEVCTTKPSPASTTLLNCSKPWKEADLLKKSFVFFFFYCIPGCLALMGDKAWLLGKKQHCYDFSVNHGLGTDLELQNPCWRSHVTDWSIRHIALRDCTNLFGSKQQNKPSWRQTVTPSILAHSSSTGRLSTYGMI